MHWAALCLGMFLAVFAPAMSWLGASLVLCVSAVVAWRFVRLRSVLWIGVGVVYAFFRLDLALEQQIPLTVNQSINAQITVLDVVTQESYGQKFLAQAQLDDGQTYRVNAYDSHQQIWQVGQVSRCIVRLRPNIGAVNATGFNVEAWSLSQGLDGSANIGKQCQIIAQQTSWQFWRTWRAAAWQRLQNLDSEHAQGKAMVAALAVGVQDSLHDDTWDAMRQLGIVHLVSISGVHVTMLALLVAWLTGQVLRFLPLRINTPLLWQCWAGVFVALLYALVAGLQVPTQRTVWMLLVFAIALSLKWRLSIWQIWWMALAVVLFIQPAALLSVGLWLSFGLVAIMIWTQQSWQQAACKWCLVWRLQVALMLLTIVFVGAFFHVVPLMSPFANAVAIPWFSWVLTPLALLAMILPWDALLLMVVALAQYSVDVSVWAAAFTPMQVIAAPSKVMLVLAAIAAFVCVLPYILGLRVIAVLIVVAYMAYRPPVLQEGQLRMQVLDVGQGLSVLLNTQNHRLLFDTGRGSAHTVVLPAVYAQAWQSLDVLVLSHSDDDHDGAADGVIKALGIDTVLVSRPENYPDWHGQDCRHQAWEWDGVWFEWLTLPLEEVKNNTNASSCVLRVVTKGQAVLIPADIGFAEEALLLQQYGDSLRSTVLILGHHGSSGSSSSAWLNVINPDVAIASSGWQNAYRHPTAAVQNRLSAHEIALYRTDLQGGSVWVLDEGLHMQKFTGRLWWQRKPFTQP